MEIVFEDEDIIVIRKPSGVATQSASITGKDCVSLIKDHLKKCGLAKNREPYVGVIHRLDQPVAGILVFAKNERAAANLSKQVQSDSMSKCYHAVVEGRVQDITNRELVNNIYKDSKENKAVVIKGDMAVGKNIKVQKAILCYSTEKPDDNQIISGIPDENMKCEVSLLKIELKTGRFHQIRAQLSNMGYPIAGDRKYGASIPCPSGFAKGQGENKGAIALVADVLEFKHPVSNKKMKFEY